MFSFVKKDSEAGKDTVVPITSGIVLQIKEVEALMSAAEDIALNIIQSWIPFCRFRSSCKKCIVVLLRWKIRLEKQVLR